MVGEENGVVPPNDPFRADHPGEPLKGRDDHIVLAGDSRLRIRTVGGHGHLKIVGVAFQLREPLQHRCRILRPEHDAVHRVRRQFDTADLFWVHGIAGTDIALFQPPEKPLGIMGRNVRFEQIHPFDDGNGRVGRLIMFKECLRHDIMPFILDDKRRSRYLQGIREWFADRYELVDVVMEAQSRFESQIELQKLQKAAEFYQPEEYKEGLKNEDE